MNQNKTNKNSEVFHSSGGSPICSFVPNTEVSGHHIVNSWRTMWILAAYVRAAARFRNCAAIRGNTGQVILRGGAVQCVHAPAARLTKLTDTTTTTVPVVKSELCTISGSNRDCQM